MILIICIHREYYFFAVFYITLLRNIQSAIRRKPMEWSDKMRKYYPVSYEVGDIVFTSIGARLFGQISEASRCWSNHVGMIIGHDGMDYIVAESRVPLSSTTTLDRFIRRSTNQHYAVKRLTPGLTVEQKERLLDEVPARLNKIYHTGFKYDSARQFCSKFVFDIYKHALLINVGKLETFDELLKSNPDAKLNFWKLWFLGSIPWARTTVTPASLFHDENLSLIYSNVSEERKQPVKSSQAEGV